MNPNIFEMIVNSIALTSAVALIAPRIVFHLELRRLNKDTVGSLGATAYKPKHMVSSQSVTAAAESVKKALTKRTRNFGWIVREHNTKVGSSNHGNRGNGGAVVATGTHITQAHSVVQIEGFVPAAKIAELTSSADQNHADHLDFSVPAVDIKIRVDIYERNDGSEIVWKYLPNNQADAEARNTVLDPRFNSLLSHTNSQLLSQLNPSLVSV
jgi:hypothetical protein